MLSSEIKSILNNSKYSRCYLAIIERAQNRWSEKPIGIYTEKHHIIPRCMGGSNDALNISYLTAKEHFVCHQLLYRAAPKEFKYKLLYACVYGKV
jgi:hypothetical protein